MKQYSLLFLLLLIPLASAATITGTVYDYSLQPVFGAIVKINTTPEQTQVAQEGVYLLEVPAGHYLLTVSKVDAQGLSEQDQAEIDLPESGTFTYDLILFREIIEFEEPDLDEKDLGLQEQTFPTIPLAIIVAVVIIAVLLILRRRQPQKEEEQDELQTKLVIYLKKHKRTTQKEVRKEFPHSEAKISLLLTDLESKGTITKIKKGRGNIIVYKKVK